MDPSNFRNQPLPTNGSEMGFCHEPLSANFSQMGFSHVPHPTNGSQMGFSHGFVPQSETSSITTLTSTSTNCDSTGRQSFTSSCDPETESLKAAENTSSRQPTKSRRKASKKGPTKVVQNDDKINFPHEPTTTSALQLNFSKAPAAAHYFANPYVPVHYLNCQIALNYVMNIPGQLHPTSMPANSSYVFMPRSETSLTSTLPSTSTNSDDPGRKSFTSSCDPETESLKAADNTSSRQPTKSRRKASKKGPTKVVQNDDKINFPHEPTNSSYDPETLKADDHTFTRPPAKSRSKATKKICNEEAKKDPRYDERRARNNAAAKRSRDKRNAREDKLAVTVLGLQKVYDMELAENIILEKRYKEKQERKAILPSDNNHLQPNNPH